MNQPQRPVDIAMHEDRPEKNSVRNLWVEEVRAVAKEFPQSEEPWYLTLSGAEGLDIQLIIESGLVSLTEVGSIAEKDQHRIVAVERSNQAILELQRRFVGLRIKEVDFRDLLHGEEQFTWPQGDDRRLCRARVVNLDLNAPLRAQQIEGNIRFPVLEWIRKLCQIHAHPPRADWTLCLTLHGEVVWPEQVNRFANEFLIENFQREPLFAEGCRKLLGEELFSAAVQSAPTDFTKWRCEDQQRFIMVMVPKIITRLVHQEGWQVRTERNLRYGGGDFAPMVTWVVKFAWDADAIATPDANYRAALRDVFSGLGIVSSDGSIIATF